MRHHGIDFSTFNNANNTPKVFCVAWNLTEKILPVIKIHAAIMFSPKRIWQNHLLNIILGDGVHL